MASSYGVIKNNVVNFLKNTKAYGYSTVDDKILFMEKNVNRIPGQFYELMEYGTLKHMVHNSGVILGLCIDSKYKDENSLSVFAYAIYNEKLYCSERLDAKSFNPSMRRFNGFFKAYCGFSPEKAFEYFIESFGCVNDQDKDIKEMIVDNICEEVTDLLNEIPAKQIEYLNAKKCVTDANTEVRRRIRVSEERKRVDELQLLLDEAKEKLSKKRQEIIEEENLEILSARSKASKREHDNLLLYYRATIKHHTTIKPIPNAMVHNIQSSFLRMLEKVKDKALAAYKNKSGD